jgi:hypothetical protein
MRVSMTPREMQLFQALQLEESAKSDWFFSRLVAKDAARSLWNKGHGSGTFPADMESDTENGRVICRPRGEPNGERFPPVAVTVVKGKVAAFSANADKLGIGMVLVKKGDAEANLRQRAAQLAVADALRIPAEGLAVEAAKQPGLMFVKHAGKRLRVQTARHKDAIIATTTCED